MRIATAFRVATRMNPRLWTIDRVYTRMPAQLQRVANTLSTSCSQVGTSTRCRDLDTCWTPYIVPQWLGRVHSATPRKTTAEEQQPYAIRSKHHPRGSARHPLH